MEYGMPPQSGWGMGIDRIFSILTEQANIRDGILFPLMKPLNNNGHIEELVTGGTHEVSPSLANQHIEHAAVPPLPTVDEAE